MGKTGDAIPWYPYGVHAAAPVDYLNLLLMIHGNREGRISFPSSYQKREKDLPDGEVIFYHPPTGSKIHFKTDGSIEVVATGDLTATVSGDATLTVEGDVTADVEGDVSIDSEGTVTVDGATAVNILSAGPVSVTAASGDVNIEATGGDVNVTSGGAGQRVALESLVAKYDAHEHNAAYPVDAPYLSNADDISTTLSAE